MTRTATGRTGRITRAATTALLGLACALPAYAAGLSGEAPIWTDKPIRIDRDRQALERVAVERKTPPLVLQPSTRVKVPDSASFEDGGRLYLLTDAVAVHPRQLCRAADESVIACGQQARIYFRRLIANRTFTCHEDLRIGPASLVTCAVAEADLAQTLVSKGAAWAATPRLESHQQAAMAAGTGIWLDADCRALKRCPPPKRRGR